MITERSLLNQGKACHSPVTGHSEQQFGGACGGAKRK